jgi:hypothetical protein
MIKIGLPERDYRVGPEEQSFGKGSAPVTMAIAPSQMPNQGIANVATRFDFERFLKDEKKTRLARNFKELHCRIDESSQFRLSLHSCRKIEIQTWRFPKE